MGREEGKSRDGALDGGWGVTLGQTKRKSWQGPLQAGTVIAGVWEGSS